MVPGLRDMWQSWIQSLRRSVRICDASKDSVRARTMDGRRCCYGVQAVDGWMPEPRDGSG